MPAPKECFVKCLIKGLRNTQALSGGFHLRSKADICATDLLKGEYRHLDRNSNLPPAADPAV